MKLLSSNHHSGFTLLEVLVGILIATTFTLTALQALVIAAVFQVKAAQSSGATNWIQEQIEAIKFQASELTADENLCNAETAEEGYGDALEAQLPASQGEHTINGVTWKIVDNTNEFPGEDLWLLRQAKPKAEEPYNVLTVEYATVLDNNGNPSSQESDIITQFYTEVIPDAAFDCN